MQTESLLLILAFLVAFLAAFSATPLAVKIAYKIGAVDVPKDGRRMHKKPIPRLGGIAIVFGFMVSVVCFCKLPYEFIGIIIGAMIIVVLGVLDDRKPIPAMIKFVVQICAAIIPVLFGVKIEIFTNPNLFSASEYWVLGGLSVPITILWIVGLTNAVNLIDGLDGLAAGVASISSLCLLVIALMVSETNIAVFTAKSEDKNCGCIRMIDQICKNLSGMFLIITHLRTTIRMGKRNDTVNVICNIILGRFFNGLGNIVHTADGWNDPDFISYCGTSVFTAISLEIAFRLFLLCNIFFLIGICQQVA